MNVAEFDRVAATFTAFHQKFARLFGRREARQRSEQYRRGVLGQPTDRRNAENVAEAIEGATPRALQRLLTEGSWKTETLALLAGAFLLTVELEWGINLPDLRRPQVARVGRELLPRRN